MVTTTLENMLRGYVALYITLEKRTMKFHAALQADGNADFSAFEEWRQKIMREIQNIDSRLHVYLNQSANTMTAQKKRLLEDFAGRQAELIRGILQVDASVITLTQQKITGIKTNLINLGQGRLALQGYSSSATISPTAVDKNA
jgi:hypothetical protein